MLFRGSRLISSLCLIVVALSMYANGQTPKTKTMAKEELENLMNATLPFAQQMLVEYGEFFPYGSVVTSKGEIVSIGASDGYEHPPSQKLIDLMTENFRAKAKTGEYRATAIAYDVRVTVPSTGLKSDAIAIRLDHAEGLSVVVFVPYTLGTGQKITYGETFAQKGDEKMFPRR